METAGSKVLFIHCLPLCTESIVSSPLVIEETQRHGVELQTRHVLFFLAQVNSELSITSFGI
jgi:ornithine carbamoyltransferase